MGSADPPVFVVGAPRSGTSLLYRLLCLHPESVWVSNWLSRAPRVTAVASLSRFTARAQRLRGRVWFGTHAESAYAGGPRRTPVAQLLPRPVEGEPFFRAYGLPEASDEAEPTRRQTALRGAVADLTRFGGGRVFVSKRTAHNRRLPLLHAIFPDARFVVVTRDGRAVAESLSRAPRWHDSRIWWYGDTPLSWEEEGGDPWELCARHWVKEVEAVEHGLARLPAPNVLQLRYEDFVADPQSTLVRIGEFTGLPPGRHWRRAYGRVQLPTDDGSWRRRLGDAAERVESFQAGWLRKYDYLS